MARATYPWLGRFSSALRGRSVGAVFAVILIEILILSALSTGKYYHLASAGDESLQALVWLPLPVKAVAGAVAIALLAEILRALMGARGVSEPAGGAGGGTRRRWWVLNVVCVVPLAIILASFEHSWDAGPSFGGGRLTLFLLTPPLWLGVATSWIGLAALSTRSVSRGGAFLLLATLFAAFLLDAGVASRVGALLLPATLSLVRLLLSIGGVELLDFPSSVEGFPVVGTPGFQVLIAPPCAGYQGILLSLVLVGVGFYFLRPRVTASRVAAVLFASAAALYLLNALRIAILIVIGSRYSPEVAVLGFHTNFGLLSAVVVSLVSLALLIPQPRNALPSSASGSVPGETSADEDILRDVDFLLPLTLLLAASLVTGLATGDFNWLYPLPIAAAALGLYLIRERVTRELGEGGIVALLAGAAAFAVWIILIPDDPTGSAAFQETLFSAPLWIAAPWLILRILGSVIIVPLAEELAFRGFGVSAVRTLLGTRLPAALSSIIAIAVTSVAYGAVHSSFLAASLVGVIYGGVRLWTGRVWDAIVAHAVSNALLALYVLLFFVWSYW